MIPGAPQGFKIEWSDDFNGDGQPNSTSWDIRQDGPIKDNGEVQKYSNDKANVFLSGGSMCIAPQRDANKSATDFTLGWTSGRVECLKSFACDPGKQMIFQARLRTGFDPKSQKWNADQQSGVWPAFWALGESFRHPRGSWPGCGEWDIMEKRGDWDHTVPSVHYGTNGTATASLDHKFLSGPDKSFDQGTFQTFSLRVDRSTPGKETLTYMMDQAVMYTLNQASAVAQYWTALAQSPFFPIFNVAIGTAMGGVELPNSKTATGLAAGMEVDYFVCYKSA